MGGWRVRGGTYMLCVGLLSVCSTLTRGGGAVGVCDLEVAPESVGGFDFTRFFGTDDLCVGSTDSFSAASSRSHLERFRDGVEGPACCVSSVDMVGGR